MKSKIPWLRVMVEGVVIVGSILLAFGIDAWWEDLGEESAEVELLERLQRDFTVTRDRYRNVLGDHERGAAAATELLQELVVGEMLPTTRRVDSLVATVTVNSRTSSPPVGALNAFFQAPDLVRSRELADLLHDWPRLVDEILEEEREMLRGVTDRWTPHLASLGGLNAYMRSGPYHGTNGIVGPPPRERTPIRVDQRFVNNIEERLMWEQFAVLEISRATPTLERILTLLTAELEGIAE